MCADFRVKCEVEVRGLTALFLYAAYRRYAVSPVPRRGGICEKPWATLPRALSGRIPFFRAGAKYHGIHHASRRPTAAPILRVGRGGGEEQAAYEQNARTTWRFRNSYVRLL